MKKCRQLKKAFESLMNQENEQKTEKLEEDYMKETRNYILQSRRVSKVRIWKIWMRLDNKKKRCMTIRKECGIIKAHIRLFLKEKEKD